MRPTPLANRRRSTESVEAGTPRRAEHDGLLGQLFEALPTPMLVGDLADGSILSANPAFAQLLGVELSELAGAVPPFAWWGGEDIWTTPDERTEALLRRADGELVPVAVECRTLSAANGGSAGRMAVFHDLRDRRSLERQLIQSGKLAAVGELAAGVAHEINNPLFAILALVEFLEREAEPGTKRYERLLLIQETALEIKATVRALLDFAREPEGAFTSVELEELAAQSVDLVRRMTSTKDVEIVERYPDAPTVLEASPNQLKQIFLNLLLNAIQAMPRGGTVTVEVGQGDGFATATVSDEGPGIPEDAAERIFEPFYTQKRDQGGSGLGLAVSLGIAELHGGKLTASSPPEGGASFELRLPIPDPGKEQ